MKGLWHSVTGRLDTLAKFAIISALPILLLELGLTYLVNDFIRTRTLSHAIASAESIGRLGVETSLGERELDEGLRPQTERHLDSLVRDESLLDADLTGITIWNEDLSVAYPNSPEDEASLDEIEQVEAALTGATGGFNFDRGGSSGEEIAVFVPLQLGTGGAINGVLEVTAPNQPVAAAIRADLNAFYIVLVGGLGLLYAALLGAQVQASWKLRKKAAEKEHQALHDVLTGLANRALFHDRVRQAVKTAERERHTAAVMLMDLDRFKEINDTLGHHHGDIVLQETARRLQSALRESDTIARLGGDEFAVLLPHIEDPAAAMNVTEKIQEALHQPFSVQGLTLDIRTSIGVAFFPAHGRDVDTLLQRADVAMYLAKAAHSVCEVYASERDQYSPSRLALVGELREAIENKEFEVYYQPKVDLRTRDVRGVEALLRWHHPIRATIPPEEFIPLAEHTGLIEPLTFQVIDEVLKQCGEWKRDGLELKVAVNLSTRNLLDLTFPDRVMDACRRWQVPTSALQFEITESTILADPTRAMSVLTRLSRMGVELSIDDFGTGYSSLVHLRQLPLKELKIDKSFVMNMAFDENDAVIVRSLIDLGRNLGLSVVAEGVETEEVWNRLASLGCDYAQGFYQSRPMPADQLRRWMNVMQPGALSAPPPA